MSAGAVPPELRYTKSHEWVRVEGGEVVVGITDHAQQELTDIVFVDLPKVGADVKAGASVLVLESVKTVADVYAPVAGQVVAVNETLKGHPEFVNRSPYGDGWLFRLRVTDAVDPAATMSAADYAVFAAAASG
ncbi:MAG TPA: glycine cleavage system protein GcvH [Thermoplasmata archaeon]|jgi:glycine cleavage system H protein|nr:glycine cleavage system protein GcvH [Thermoplasmata archaeon]